ncbi:GNAT family N-acetyltransferase [Streptococcus hongkongensis]
MQKCYVTKDARRQGIACALLAAVELAAKEEGYHQMYLESSSL